MARDLFSSVVVITGASSGIGRATALAFAEAKAIVRCAKRPRREVIVGASGRQLVLMHALAPSLFERIMTRNVGREHFRNEPLGPTPGNLREPMPEWTGTTGGWKEGDASPKGSGPARVAISAGAATLAAAVGLAAVRTALRG